MKSGSDTAKQLNTGVVLPRNNHLLVIACFPPSNIASSHHAAKLVQMLSKAGGVVTTASGPEVAFARISLIFRTRRLFSQSVEKLTKIATSANKLIIYPSGLGINAIEKPRWRSRRMEEWRRLSLAYKTAMKSEHCYLVFENFNINDKNFWLSTTLAVILSIRKPFKFKVVSQTTQLQKLVHKIMGKIVDQPSQFDALDHLVRLSKSSDNQNSAAGVWSLMLLQSAETTKQNSYLSDDLKMLAHAINQLSGTGGFSVLQHIDANQTGSQQSRNTKALEIANTVKNDGLLSLFEEHILNTEIEYNNLSSAILNDRHAFLDWYIHSATARKSYPPLPIPYFQITRALGKDFKLTETNSSRDLPEFQDEWLVLASRVENAFHNTRTPLGRLVFFAEIILDYAPRCRDLGFLPKVVHDYFSTPLGGIDGNLSRMEILCAGLAGVPPTEQITDEITNSPEIRNWYQDSFPPQITDLSRFSTSTRKAAKQASGHCIRITGITEGESGLARNTIMSAKAFNQAGFDVSMHNLGPYSPTENLPATPNRTRLLRDITLHHCQTSSMPRHILAPEASGNGPTVHIGFLLWEMDKTPPTHMLAGKMLDEIWCPSKFVADIYKNAYGREVINIGKSIALPEVDAYDLSALNIPANNKMFLMCFDAHSSVERKNPLAAVKAFLAAFPNKQDVHLIIKTTPTGLSHWGDPNGQMQKINALARKDRRIIVITKMLPFAELLAMVNRADCLISPHRAEGFGYMPAYAMYYGTPVIATDYSGTQDFCIEETAFPVAYQMIEAKAGETIVPLPDASWADIDMHDLVSKMLQIIDDPELATRKATKGRELIRSHYSLESHANRYLQRLITLGAVSPEVLP